MSPCSATLWVTNCNQAAAKQALVSANAPDANGLSAVRDIVNKLTLLKHAAVNNASNDGLPIPELNIQSVVDKLDAANNEHMAYSMYIDEPVTNDLSSFLGNAANSNAISKGFQTEMAKMGEDIANGSKDLQITAAKILDLVTNPNSEIGQRLIKDWNDRIPAGTTVTKLTFGQAKAALEVVDLSDLQQQVPNDIPTLTGDGDAVAAINTAGRSDVKVAVTGDAFISYTLPTFSAAVVPVDSSSNPDDSTQPGNNNEQTRNVTEVQDTAARNLSAALEVFIDTALGYQPSAPIADLADAYREAVDLHVLQGTLMMEKAGTWCVNCANDNSGDEPLDPYTGIFDNMKQTYNTLMDAMAKGA
ncbi:hypothetical protein EDB81DRAFT_888864 [Dactylonectria macrodidyma]|uniref:Uncharacterized protein n=1 Tax=Dactylonectria macrodidyma TaxID=307937 RepID=A0A9P9E1M4_9HYPO|nr:hypothetical protein EDB81DRAFT_888864 [Dactylonectria macrodidyma]